MLFRSNLLHCNLVRYLWLTRPCSDLTLQEDKADLSRRRLAVRDGALPEDSLQMAITAGSQLPRSYLQLPPIYPRFPAISHSFLAYSHSFLAYSHRVDNSSGDTLKATTAKNAYPWDKQQAVHAKFIGMEAFYRQCRTVCAAFCAYNLLLSIYRELRVLP